MIIVPDPDAAQVALAAGAVACPRADCAGMLRTWTRARTRRVRVAGGGRDGPEAMAAGHGDLEAHLQVDSRESYRLLLQGHLDERARREPRRTGVTGSDGVTRPRVEKGHQRGLTSVFGAVTVTRKAYRATPIRTAADAGADVPPEHAVANGAVSQAMRVAKTPRNLYPADAGLNLPPGRPSAGLGRLAAIETARGSYDDARDGIERVTGVRLGK